MHGNLEYMGDSKTDSESHICDILSFRTGEVIYRMIRAVIQQLEDRPKKKLYVDDLLLQARP